MGLEHFIAIIAAFIAFITWYYGKRHNENSVMPLVVGEVNRFKKSEELVIEHLIHNRGLGPAKIVNFTLLWDGKEIDKESFKENVLSLSDKKIYVRFGILVPNGVVAKDGQVTLISLEYCEDLDANNEELYKKIREYMDEYAFLIESTLRLNVNMNLCTKKRCPTKLNISVCRSLSKRYYLAAIKSLVVEMKT